jgi:hypothetical protein
MSIHLSAELAEDVEAEFMFQYVSNAPSSVASELGIATARIGGGVVMSVRNDGSGYWSKALGFGFSEPVTADLIDHVLDFYRAQGSHTAVLQIAPSVLPGDWHLIRDRHQLRADATLIKLACRIEDYQGGSTDLRVGPVAPDEIFAWARVTMDGFGMPRELADMVAAGVRVADFRPFAAWDGEEMVATANLFVRGEVASLNSAATLGSHRNRGAQSALLAARAKEAANAGCRWLVAEAEQPPGHAANPSLDNVLRAGLRPLYNRVNWTWRSPG